MDTVELFNGLANRFLFILAGREKILPFGADLVIPDAPVEALRSAIDEPSHLGPLEIEGPARDLWELAYRGFAEPIPGVLGAVLARRDPITLRLALIFALADNDSAIRLPHLEAALAVVEYATESARALFGAAIGDKLAERILAALQGAGADGLTRSRLSAELGRNVPKHLLDGALLVLEQAKRARRERRQGAKGGPSEVWFPVDHFVYSFRTVGREGANQDDLVRKDEKNTQKNDMKPHQVSQEVRNEKTKRIPAAPSVAPPPAPVSKPAVDLTPSAAAWLALTEAP